jgi:uncharacterized protein (TIGR02996 family)
MSERDDLYRAVLAAPDDDAPRLILADWLDEHGDPDRAEFIRLQCRLARLPAATARRQLLEEEADRAERKWRKEWLGPTLERVNNAGLTRGFVGWVRLTVEQFLDSADHLLRTEPVRWWEFHSPASLFRQGPGFDRLAESPDLARVRGLVCGGYAPDELLSVLTTSPHLGGLRALNLRGRLVRPTTVTGFFKAAAGIEEVEADSSNVSDLRDLWRRGAPARLKRLSLVRCQLRDHSVEQLAAAPALRNLETLRLDGNEFYDRGALALAESDHLGGLEELSLAGAPVGDLGAMFLARSPALRRLRVLNLASCGVDNAGAQALADSPHLGALECLCLDDNRVSVEVEAELEKRFGPGVYSVHWGTR